MSRGEPLAPPRNLSCEGQTWHVRAADGSWRCVILQGYRQPIGRLGVPRWLCVTGDGGEAFEGVVDHPLTEWSMNPRATDAGHPPSAPGIE